MGPYLVVGHEQGKNVLTASDGASACLLPLYGSIRGHLVAAAILRTVPWRWW